VRDEWRKVAVASLLAFFVLASYELVRSPIESLFLAEYSSESLPRVWLLVAAGAVGVTAIYNRFANGTAIGRVLRVAILASIAVLALLLPSRDIFGPVVLYALYVWKDVYIVLLVEAFWTLANSSFGKGTAKWVYGVFCAAGSFGAMAANAVGGQIALKYGSEVEIWLCVPVLLVAWAISFFVSAPEAERPRSRTYSPLGDGIEILRSSRPLMAMLVMVLSVQLVVTLIDFEFQRAAEVAFADTDGRTAAMHGVYFWISTGALVMQLLSGVVMKLLGVGGTLLMIPVTIMLTIAGLLVSPVFAVAAAAKVLGKVFDYSVFRTAKEVLYIGLGRRERTEGKALVDILTYRVAKGGASLLLQLLIMLGALSLAPWLALVFVATWLAAAVFLAKHDRRTSS
jgi:ATP/ADP translocase